MNIYRELIFAYLEEDNTQRVYFRVKPLLAASGDLQEEAHRAWPDDGALRIVPDRAEQYHFKDRMRTLGAFCMVNLTHATEEANKIRTNKNYNPSKGESNQYILYSDAVQPLPPHSFFEVLSGTAADAAALAQQAVTPLFYIKQADTLFGPVDRSAPAEAAPAAPAEGTLYEVPCPDGKIRTIFCVPHTPAEAPAPAAAEAPVKKELPVKREAHPASPAPKAEAPQPPAVEPKTPAEAPEKADEPLALGKTLHILDESKDFDEQLSSIAQPLSTGANLLNASAAPRSIPRPVRSEPLSGTPLMHSNFRAATPKPKNQLQEVVSAQWRAARYEPPAAPLPAGATLQPVENPVEEACRCLTQAWKLPEAQQQLLDHVLSLPGIGQRLTHRGVTAASEGTPLQAVLSARLQDLEADRLSALVELDKAKANIEAFRKATLEGLQAQKTQTLDALDKQVEERQNAAAALQAQLAELTAQRDALQAQIDTLQGATLPQALTDALTKAHLAAPMAGTPLRMSPVPGERVAPAELIARVRTGLAAYGYDMPQGDVVTLLTLLACCPRFGLIAPQLAPAVELVKALFAVCGWSTGLQVQETLTQRPVLSALPAGATPAALVTPLMIPALNAPVHTVMVGKVMSNLTRTAAWELTPWPVWQLPAMPALTAPQQLSEAAPISAASLAEYAQAAGASEEELNKCLAPIVAALTPLGVLSGTALTAMKQFIRVSAAYMEGGLAAAMDRGLLLWLGALASAGCKVNGVLANLLDEYPLTAAFLK